MREAAPAHYVTHNKVTRVPRTFIYLDSEARREVRERDEVQTFRLAVARRDRRGRALGHWTTGNAHAFGSVAELWPWVAAQCPPGARTVLVAHNLAYDLRITDALRALPALGWRLRDIRLDRGATYARFSSGTRSLVCVDSLAWVPVGLERLGELCGIPKLPLPAWDDTDEAWRARCARDVEILGEVWRRLIDWIRTEDLGNWKPSGAGQAWAAFRHRFMTDRILAHDDVRARAAERRAAWAGRCEVWRHGVVRGGPFTEWDFSGAYARVGAECDVPVRLVGSSTRVRGAQLAELAETNRVLADCTVTTDTPTVPASVDDRIAWPVGTFTTTLWDCEIELARAHGATVVPSRVWWYDRAPALAGFCAWILEHDPTRHRALDPVVVCAAKHWSRALIGRFGSRWSDWVPVGDDPTGTLGLSRVIDGDTGERYDLLRAGGECRRRSATYDAPDAVVSVMSWIMAQCRVRLWGACVAAGLGNVLYVDTDGLIVTEAGSEALRAAGIPGLRPKAAYPTAELLAPRQVVLSGTLRASGVPRGARAQGDGTFRGEVWQELASSIRDGHPDAVHVALRSFRPSGHDRRRDHLAGGLTAPWRLTVPS